MKFSGAIRLQATKEQFHRGSSPRKENRVEKGFVKSQSGWRCFVSGRVRDENSM